MQCYLVENITCGETFSFYASIVFLSRQKRFENDGKETDKSSEGVHQFNVPNSKLPSTFQLLRVQGLPAWANTNTVSINDVIQVSENQLCLEF